MVINIVCVWLVKDLTAKTFYKSENNATYI